jgi:hypothetical protein
LGALCVSPSKSPLQRRSLWAPLRWSCLLSKKTMKCRTWPAIWSETLWPPFCLCCCNPDKIPTSPSAQTCSFSLYLTVPSYQRLTQCDSQFRCYGPMVEQRYIEPVFKKVLKAVPSCKLNNPKPRNLTFSANGYAAKIRLGSDCGFGVDVPWDEAVARNALAFSSHWCYNKFNPRDPVPEGKFVRMCGQNR